jgi:excisionase family DNA binding protein
MSPSQSTQIDYQESHHIPTYIPLPEAAKKYGLSEAVLTQLIQVGKIQAIRLSTGELLVAAENNGSRKTKAEIIAKEFVHLRGEKITVTEAAGKYDLHRDTILEWVQKGYIAVLKPGYRMELDAADIAYCAKIYQQKLKDYGGQLRGVNIFDEQGNPYQLVHPALAERRRRQK